MQTSYLKPLAPVAAVAREAVCGEVSLSGKVAGRRRRDVLSRSKHHARLALPQTRLAFLWRFFPFIQRCFGCGGARATVHNPVLELEALDEGLLGLGCGG